MISLSALREDKTPYIDSLNRRNMSNRISDLDEVLALDDEYKSLKGAVDDLRRSRNVISQKINEAKKSGSDASEFISQAKSLPAKIKSVEDELVAVQNKRDALLRSLPNTLADAVPSGLSEDENVERAVFNAPPQFDFSVRNHAELLEELGLVDFEASRQSSGAGFFYLKDGLALLDQALMQYGISVMKKHGFSIITPPYLVKREVLEGMIDADAFAESIYSIADQDLHLIATSEFPLVSMVMNQDISISDSPLKLCGISPCFRAEVGAHGIDEKGLFRTHQFHKIEQVVICPPSQSQAYFEKLLAITNEIFSSLGLHFRYLEMCTGDLGLLKHQQYDVEVWSPRRNDFFEVGSCSNLTDAQARRLNIRLKNPDGSRVFAHTLNNTAVATSRAIVAIVENFQRSDGSIAIPEVLHPFMHGVTELR